MPAELEFSIMAPGGESIRPLLERFEAESGVRVRVRQLAWDTAWGAFVRAALYNDGPDVSELGTTWVNDLIGMNALRSFDAAEVAALGRALAFLPAAWKTAARTQEGGSERVWSIPWVTGARLIFYRKALLERAGIDPRAAFRSNAELIQTVERLQAAGVRVPWTVPTGPTHTTLLNVSSWVWAAGGDFIRADGRATAFTRPESLAGLRDYFTLGRFLHPEVRGLNGLAPDDRFLNHEDTALTLSGPWLFCRARKNTPDCTDGESDFLGAALPPGPSFVGGSNLIVWKYSRNPDAAVRLVRFLTQHAAQLRYCQAVGLLPARMQTLESPPFATDPLWRMAEEGLKTGRTFPIIRLWGLVEDRLTAAFSQVWADLLAREGGFTEKDVEVTLEKHLVPLAERLDQLLERE